jgi:hypothetical protein
MRTYLAAHWADILNSLLLLAGFLAGRGYIRDDRLRKLIEDAVAFAEQWRKSEARETGKRPDGAAALTMAHAYIDQHAPELADDVTRPMIDAAITRVLGTTSTPKTPARKPDGKFAPKSAPR